MKAKTIVVVLVAFLATLLAAPAANATVTTTNTPRAMSDPAVYETAQYGWMAQLTYYRPVVLDDSLVLQLQSVTENRCPLGAVCVWPGTVTAELHVAFGDTHYEEIDLTLQPDAPQLATARFLHYDLVLFQVAPVPVVGRETNPNDVVAILFVARVDKVVPDTVELAIGERTVLLDGLLAVEWIDVHDSRCPVDLDCNWAGLVRTGMFVTTEGGVGAVELTLDSTAPELARGETMGFDFELIEVRPLPRSDETPQPDDYRAYITVEPLIEVEQ